MINSKLNDILNQCDQNDPRYIISFYIKNNLEKINTITLNDLASACYVSKSMIIKFYKELGYASFRDFKDSCIDYYESIQQDSNHHFNSDNFKKNSFDYLNKQEKAIHYMLETLNYEYLDQLIHEMRRSRHVYVLAHGYSRLFCLDLQYRLDHFHISTTVVDPYFEKEYPIKESDMFIIFSLDGNLIRYSRSTLKHIFLKCSNCWLITCTKGVALPCHVLEINDEDPDFYYQKVQCLLQLIYERLEQISF